MLSHPIKGIVKIQDSTKLQKSSSLSEFQSFLIVMEYIPTGDLLEFMNKPPIKYNHEIAMDITKQFLLQISKSLSFYNENIEYIHIDIKPENVLVAYEKSTMNSNIKFYLADFSCSMHITDFTIDGHIGGTFDWVCLIILNN